MENRDPNNLTEQTVEYVRKQKKRRLWRGMIIGMAAIVVFCTTYAMILPAVSMSAKAYCGKEEHIHTDECYYNQLVCELSETATHVHDDTCYSQKRTLFCDEEESEGHKHTDKCKTVEKTLVCEKAETAGHTHETDCYDADGELICEKDEAEAHTHENDCYEEKEVLTCDKEEIAGHKHTEDCYKTEDVLQCDKDKKSDKSAHTHTTACYEKVLDCERTAHTHTLICYSNPEADLETESVWEATLPDKLSGIYAQDIVTVAESQKDYQESQNNYIVTEDGEKKGYTRYGEWYGDPYGDWCAMFVSFCINYAEIKDMPLEANCEQWVKTLNKEKYDLYRTAEEYTPSVGDLMFLSMKENGKADHIGIVTELIPETENMAARVKVLEGNSSERVQYVSYEYTDARILGYGKLPEQKLYCRSDHVHTKACLDKETAVEAVKSEAESTDTAETITVSKKEQAIIDKVIEKIDALPSAKKVEEKLTSLEDDQKAYEKYYEEIALKAKSAYALYQELGSDLGSLVTNSDKLFDLAWLWSAQTLEVKTKLPISCINQNDGTAQTTLVYGGSVREKLGTEMTFTYWDAMVIEKVSDETYVVDKYETSEESKLDYEATSDGGFVLLLYDTKVDAAVGDYVVLDFNLEDVGKARSATYGNVLFSGRATTKPAKNNKVTPVDGEDTRNIIEVNLYDYNSKINTLYSSNKKYPGFQQDEGQTSVSKASGSNFGNNITEDLDAGIKSVTNQGGAINATCGADGSYGYGNINVPISGTMSKTLINGYPALTDGTSLSYLFSDSAYAKKQNSQSINGLFQLEKDTGAYTFNSRKNHAQFNAADDTFTLYDEVISSNFTMYPFGNFLPFNDIKTECAQAYTMDRAYIQSIANSALSKANSGMGTEYSTLASVLTKWISLMDSAYGTDWTIAHGANAYFGASAPPDLDFTKMTDLLKKVYVIDYDEPTDFYFGMEMKMNLVQPKGGLTGTDGKQPMRFYFTGDDDVWVYLDGVMFLDLSGIHRHVGGEIDFVNGKIYYYGLEVSTGDVAETPYKTVTFAEALKEAGKTDAEIKNLLNDKGTFKDYSTHTFNFYYMERGAGSGVCRMNFNFPLLQERSISVAKEVDAGTVAVLGNPDFKFQVVGEDKETLFIGGNVAYDICDMEGNKTGSGKTDANGIITLKANQMAVFSEIDENAGSYIVRELLDPDDFAQYGKISVSGETVTTKYDVTIGGTAFTGVESPLQNTADGSTVFRFTNKVDTDKLGSLRIEKKVVDYSRAKAGETFEFLVELDSKKLPKGTKYKVGDTTKTVETAGIIQLKHGEKAIIENILAGSKFTISEITEGYVVGYDGDITSSDGNQASGVIKTDTQIQVLVTNTEGGANLNLDGEKKLNNPDGNEYEFAFKLEEVDAEGTPLENGLVMETSDNYKKSGTFQFTLTYTSEDSPQGETVHYYKITEVDKKTDGVRYDDTQYIAKVTVTNKKGTVTAEVTKIWEDGTTTEADSITFTNALRSELTISKEVTGTSNPTQEPFEFTVTLTEGKNENEKPFTGTVTVVKTAADGSTTESAVTFDADGNATFTIAHNESVTIKGLPADVKYKVTENGAADYTVLRIVDDGDSVESKSATGRLDAGRTVVKFINQTRYELPTTGGSGTLPFIIAGSALICGAVVTLVILYIKRK